MLFGFVRASEIVIKKLNKGDTVDRLVIDLYNGLRLVSWFEEEIAGFLDKGSRCFVAFVLFF